MSIPDTRAPLEDHLVVYFDFLGTKYAIKSEDRAPQLLELLIRISSMRGDFDLNIANVPLPAPVAGTASPPSFEAIYLTPAITAFSDNIVLSIPLWQLDNESALGKRVAPIIAMSKLQEYLGFFASEALRIGFLLRGGATIGKLYHAGGVVFGQAMVDAYEIETQTSVYPRIVASQKLVSVLSGETGPPPIPRDADGLYCIDYFRFMIFAAGMRSGAYIQEDAKAWFDHAVRIVDENVKRLAKDGRLNELAKWSWFRRKWRDALAANPDGLQFHGISLDAFPESD